MGNGCFEECHALQEVTFPTEQEKFITLPGKAFYQNNSLTKIIIPDTISKIEESAFYDCDSLSTVVIGSGVENMGTHVFSRCPSVTDYYFTMVNAPTIHSANTWNSGQFMGPIGTEKGTAHILSNATGFDKPGWSVFFAKYERKDLVLDDMPSSTYSLRKPTVTITLYNNGAQFTSQEMYLINTNTGEKIVGILNGDHYNVVDLSKLYIGQPYAVMVSMDGMSYTFNDMITFEFDVFNYEVDSKNGMNPYYDPSAIMASGIDDDMMGVGTVTNSSTVSKYEYDVLSAKIAYLESILNKL